MLTGILICLSLFGGGGAMYLFMRKRSKRTETQQATILLESIRRVCKLVTVQGEFTEVLTHTDSKPVLFFFNSEKKAMLVIKGRAHVGIDLKRASYELDQHTRTVRVSNIPSAELISLETEVQWYDTQNGVMNKFKATDLTKIESDAKSILQNKVLGSYLIPLANEQARDVFYAISQAVSTFGWQLELPTNSGEQPRLEH